VVGTSKLHEAVAEVEEAVSAHPNAEIELNWEIRE
jgi:hypothetical protein